MPTVKISTRDGGEVTVNVRAFIKGDIGPEGGPQGPPGPQGEQGDKGDQGPGVEVLANYAALRSLETESDVVVVSDFTYTGPDGNTYTTLGGIFEWTGNTELENGGTYIRGWKRKWDNKNIQPEWWQCGGFDQRGNNYGDKNILGGAYTLGNKSLYYHHGIYNDRDRVQAAIEVVNKGGNILLQNRTYLIDISLYLLDRQKISGGLLKRVNSIVTTGYFGAQNITAGTTVGMRVGMTFLIQNTSTYLDNTQAMIITGITGNVISKISGAFNAGNTLMTFTGIIDNRK